MTQSSKIPWNIRILYWFGFALGATYLIYAVVSIILSFLDRTYGDIGGYALLLLYSLPFFIIATGFKNRRRWGWYGYELIMALIIIYCLIKPDTYGIILAILSALALGTGMLPTVRERYFRG